MDGYYMTSCRTRGMAPSEIKDAMLDGRLGLCSYEDLSPSETDEILDGFLRRGLAPDSKTPRCVDVLAVGSNAAGIPVARIEITEPSSAHTAVPAVCTYCPRNDCGCGKVGSFLMYGVLEDDPLWNAETLRDDD